MSIFKVEAFLRISFFVLSAYNDFKVSFIVQLQDSMWARVGARKLAVGGHCVRKRGRKSWSGHGPKNFGKKKKEDPINLDTVKKKKTNKFCTVLWDWIIGSTSKVSFFI